MSVLDPEREVPADIAVPEEVAVEVDIARVRLRSAATVSVDVRDPTGVRAGDSTRVPVFGVFRPNLGPGPLGFTTERPDGKTNLVGESGLVTKSESIERFESMLLFEEEDEVALGTLARL